MSDTIGNITVPEIAVSGTFPIVPEYPYGRASHPDVAIHQFGSGNAKIEQRFLLGTGARRFTVRRTWMNDACDRAASSLCVEWVANRVGPTYVAGSPCIANRSW